MKFLRALRRCLLCSPSSRRTSSVAGQEHRERRSSQTHLASLAENEAVYVLTVKTSEDIARTTTELRDKYFPRERNKLAAHLTLFHALPGAQMEHLRTTLSTVASRQARFPIATGQPALWGKAIMLPLSVGEQQICVLRSGMRNAWQGLLTNQDQQRTNFDTNKGWKPHWTIMNKEPDKEKVRAAHEDIKVTFPGAEGYADGLSLWEYLPDGRWKHERDWAFTPEEEMAML